MQGLIFLPLLIIAIRLLNLPLSLAGHHLGLAYGLSIERWPAWFWDWTKGLLVSLAVSTFVGSLLFAIVRHSPRRWWLWFWLLSLPLMLAGVFAEPLIIDPLFNHFEPLSRSHPELVAQLERVVARSGEKIAPDHMFLMKASEKTTEMNAYVTGFGSSKRVVVWDTSLKKSSQDEVLFIFGHELGPLRAWRCRAWPDDGGGGHAAGAVAGVSSGAQAGASLWRALAGAGGGGLERRRGAPAGLSCLHAL